MEDAVDKIDKRKSKKSDPGESPAAITAREHIALVKDRAKKNPVVRTYYALQGKKLLLCKEKRSGTVYKTYIGCIEPASNSENDKRVALSVLNKVKELKAAKQLEIIV